MKPKRRPGERIIRRASTQRRSQRSVGRSGYAFSHQEGFGELITSGSLMIRKHPARPSIGNVVVPSTVDSVSVPPASHPDRLDDLGVPSVISDASVMNSSDITTGGVPLSPVEEIPPSDPDQEPRTPVLV